MMVPYISQSLICGFWRATIEPTWMSGRLHKIQHDRYKIQSYFKKHNRQLLEHNRLKLTYKYTNFLRGWSSLLTTLHFTLTTYNCKFVLNSIFINYFLMLIINLFTCVILYGHAKYSSNKKNAIYNNRICTCTYKQWLLTCMLIYVQACKKF